MEHETYLRQHKRHTDRIAANDHNPDARAQASADLEKLQETYNRSREAAGTLWPRRNRT